MTARVKLLLDENLSRRLVPFLQEAYPGSTQVALLGLERADDRTLWTVAREQGYVIVTRDVDFYDLGMLLGAPPAIVWLRTGNQSKAATLAALVQHRAAIEQSVWVAAKTCIEIY